MAADTAEHLGLTFVVAETISEFSCMADMHSHHCDIYYLGEQNELVSYHASA